MAKRKIKEREKIATFKQLEKTERRKRTLESIGDGTKGVMRIISRTLAVLLVIFWALFVLGSHGLTMTSLVEGILPLVLLIVTFIAWKHRITGGILFIIFGALYAVFTNFVLIHLFIAGWQALAGILFIVDGAIRSRILD